MITFHRYGHKTEYLQYRQRLFEAQYPDKPVPLDDHWFREAGAGAGDDSDDEIEIANEVREYKCPLSMQPFVNPVTSRKCRNHSFSKASIEDVFRTTARNRDRREKGPVQITCPMPGCGNKLTQADFYDDPDLLRKAERAKEREERRRREAALREAREEEEAEERGEDEGADGDGDVEMPDADMDESTQRRIKKERSSQAPPQKKSRKLQRRTNRPVDLDSDDDMDED